MDPFVKIVQATLDEAFAGKLPQDRADEISFTTTLIASYARDETAEAKAEIAEAITSAVEALRSQRACKFSN